MRVFVVADDPHSLAEELRKEGLSVSLRDIMGMKLIVFEAPKDSLRELLRDLAQRMGRDVKCIGFEGLFRIDVLDRLRELAERGEDSLDRLINSLLSGLHE